MNTILFICLEIAIIYGLTFVLLWINNKAFKVLKQSNIFKARQSIFTNVQANIRFILIILSTLAACAVLVFNFWLFYQNKYIPGYTIALFQKFSPENWLNIGLAIFKTLIIFGLINYLKTPIIYGLTKACVFVQDLDDIEGNDESIAKFFATAQTAIINSLWLIGLNLALLFLNFPEILIQGNYTLVKIYAIFSLGTLILRSVSIVIDSLDHLSIRFSQSNHIVQIYQQFRHLLGFLRKCLETAIAILFTTFAIKQIEVIADLATFGEKLVKVVAIVGISRVLVEISKIMITKLIFIDGNQDDNTQEYKMKSTFVPLIQSIVKYLIFFFSGIFILYALGINPLPILAAAGILGVGISLGAQTLIKDIIAGFFILFEGNFFVGDFVKINNNISGYVQAIELRTTRLRNIQGHHLIIRNGDIEQITNYTKESWNKLIVEFGVSYNANLDQVYEIVIKIGKELATTNPNVIEGTIIRRIEEFRKHDILISTITKILPDTAISTSGQLRKLLKERLQQAGIEQPYAKNLILNSFEEDR